MANPLLQTPCRGRHSSQRVVLLSRLGRPSLFSTQLTVLRHFFVCVLQVAGCCVPGALDERKPLLLGFVMLDCLCCKRGLNITIACASMQRFGTRIAQLKDSGIHTYILFISLVEFLLYKSLWSIHICYCILTWLAVDHRYLSMVNLSVPDEILPRKGTFCVPAYPLFVTLLSLNSTLSFCVLRIYCRTMLPLFYTYSLSLLSWLAPKVSSCEVSTTKCGVAE